MLKKVQAYIEKYDMFHEGDHIIVGVSGGADSMCLLAMLLELREHYKLELSVVHVNHLLRQEALAEAKYVEAYCAKERISYHYVEENVAVHAKEHGVSEEEAGRTVRYLAFHKVLEEQEQNENCKIAVAHHENDLAETMLFHLVRGCGLGGLQGILPVQGPIIRPLLCLSRDEIEEYVKQKSISYCIDQSNFQNDYSRNRIRNKVIPQLVQINGQAVHHMNKTAVRLNEIELFLQRQTKEAWSQCIQISCDGKYEVNEESFGKLDLVLQKYLIKEVIHKCSGSMKDISAKHIEAVVSLFLKQVGRYQVLPNGVRANREYGKVSVTKEEKETTLSAAVEIESIPCKMQHEQLGCIEFTLLDPKEMGTIQEKSYTKWFDYDKIEQSILLRTRQEADYIALNSENSQKKLNRYFIGEKIPSCQRDKMILLADGSHIMWVIGHRISEYYKVTNETKRILQVKMEEYTERERNGN